jgi:hypothetical protein
MYDFEQEHEDRIMAHQHRVWLEERRMRRRWARFDQSHKKTPTPFDPGKHNEDSTPDDIIANSDDWKTPLGLLQIQAFRSLMKVYKEDPDKTPEMRLAEAVEKTSDDVLGEALKDRSDLVAKWLNEDTESIEEEMGSAR